MIGKLMNQTTIKEDSIVHRYHVIPSFSGMTPGVRT